MDKCLATFGEEVLYTSEGLSPITIQAIFDNEFQQVDPQTGAVVISTQPVIGIKYDQLPQKPKSGDRVRIRYIDYRVIEDQPDGQAGSRLLLHKIS
jgi:hypothetical protein